MQSLLETGADREERGSAVAAVAGEGCSPGEHAECHGKEWSGVH